MSGHPIRPAHHPTPETLLGYASGGLDEAFRVVIATHLGGCARCRADVLRGERVGGHMLEALADTPMDDGALTRCLARLDDPAPVAMPRAPVPAGMPATLAGYSIGRWRSTIPGLALITVLPPTDGRAGLHLLRLATGVKLAGHGHGGLELTVILQGQVGDHDGIYGPGDVAENAEDAHHTPMAVGEGICVCLIAVGGKLRFDHWLARLVQPFLGV